MGNKELKKIMTDLAAGHITQEEADVCMGVDKAAKEVKPKKKRSNHKSKSKTREVK